MKRTFRTVVTMLLVLVMLASVMPMSLAFIEGTSTHSDINTIVTANREMTVGDTMDVYCQIVGLVEEDRPSVNYAWSTDRPEVLRIEGNGSHIVTVRGVGVGSANVSCCVTVTYPNDAHTYISNDITNIGVGSAGSQFSIYPWTKSISVGEGFQINAITIGAGGEVRFFSNNESVASVDSNGYVTGRGAGSATITADWNGMTDTCQVNVRGQSNIITTLSPLTQTRNVSTGTSLNNIINNFTPITGYCVDAYGSGQYVTCQTTWGCSNYNPNAAGKYTFSGTERSSKQRVYLQYKAGSVTQPVSHVEFYPTTVQNISFSNQGITTY